MCSFTNAKIIGTYGTAEGITPVHEFKCDAAIKNAEDETNASFDRLIKCRRIETFSYFCSVCKEFGLSVEEVLETINPYNVHKSVLEIDFEDELAEGETLESIMRDILSDYPSQRYTFGAFLRCCQLLGIEPLDAYNKYSYDEEDDEDDDID